MSSKIIWTISIILIISVSVQADDDCGPNEVFSSCGTACPETCESLLTGEPQMCTMQCVSGCFCSDGYVRDSARNNACVSKRDCTNNLKEMSDTKDSKSNDAQFASKQNLYVFIAFNLITILLNVFTKKLF